MKDIFPTDIIHKGENKHFIELPLNVFVKDNILIPCAMYFIQEAKKRSLRQLRLVDGISTGNLVVFSLIKSKEESFCMQIKRDSRRYICEFSGTSLLSCYYGVQSFLRNAQVRRNAFVTNLRSVRGKTKNNHRNLIISLSWMENLIEFPFYNLEKWRKFIDLASELRFNRIDFMQWGCTIPAPPSVDIKAEDEWELWQESSKKEGTWPVPEAYRGLKYQEGGWRKRYVFEPWLFPIFSRTIRNSALFSVCYPPEKAILLSRWDTGRQKLVRKFWLPPFIKDKNLFREILNLIHDRGMKAGIFTTARVPCVRDEKNFETYWTDVIKFFLAYGVDDFLFETEEGPISFEHHQQCRICQEKYGDIFTGYTKKVAHQTEILSSVIKSINEKSRIGWILHVPLHAGYGNPTERREWLMSPKNYIENLNIFYSSAPKDFTFDYVPFPGEKNIHHDFLPKVYFDIFGSERIRPTGYTHAWGPVRTFLGLEIYYIDIARSLWQHNPSKDVWHREEVTKKAVEKLSSKFYGSKKTVSDLARFSINNRNQVFGEKSVVSPLVWDRSRFCISQQVLRLMLISALSRKQGSFLPYPRRLYENALRSIIEAEKRLEKVKISECLLASDWNFNEGFLERAALVKASRYALEFLLHYDSFLVKISECVPDKKGLEKLLELGLRINNFAASGQKSSWWPSSSRLGGLYDYYAFAVFLFSNKQKLLKTLE